MFIYLIVQFLFCIFLFYLVIFLFYLVSNDFPPLLLIRPSILLALAIAVLTLSPPKVFVNNNPQVFGSCRSADGTI